MSWKVIFQKGRKGWGWYATDGKVTINRITDNLGYLAAAEKNWERFAKEHNIQGSVEIIR